MKARAAAFGVVFVLLASGIAARAQDAQIYIDVRPDQDHAELNNLPEEIEKRQLSELAMELGTVKRDVMLLYTEYTAKAGTDLRGFLANISSYADEASNAVSGTPDIRDHGDCRGLFEIRMRKIKLDAYRAASFSGENHQKFFLGHMVVFRMHINKSDDYIKKCDKALHDCGEVCEEKTKIKRWKRLAAGEIHRIQDDVHHTRKSYKDLVVHARRRLHHLKNQLEADTTEAVLQYHECLARDNRQG